MYKNKRLQQEKSYMKKANNMTSNNSLPKEWEGKTNLLPVKWEEVQSKQSKIQLNKVDYRESLFMFQDGIVPLPSKFVENVSIDDNAILEEQKKELMQQVHVIGDYVMNAPRKSKGRLQVFKDIAPN
ncbi:hypothetical protein Lal_00020101 [Lupinus albus]|nr:hypothetical protein Lal_00020101 [Lupinus albus]